MGLGYIGLPTSVVIARSGIEVIGVDINQATVDAVNRGRCPIEEPELPEALSDFVAKKKIRAQTSPTPADAFIIAVPTPFTGGYKPDLSYVEAATRAIAPALRSGNLVVVESTIPVGATEQVSRWLEELRPDLTFPKRGGAESVDVMIAHCPERVLPGQMLRELVENDRIIGGVCKVSERAGQAFYEAFVTGKCLVTDSRTAELCKLSENSFRDVNIAFANELSDICEDFGVNVWELIPLANRHPRVKILSPGPGVGGHCIAVDPWFIVSALGEKARLIREARWINSARPRQVVRRILQSIEEGGIKSVGLLGLAYKPNVDDMRESPSIEIVEFLAKELAMLRKTVDLCVVEPFAKALPSELAHAPQVRKVTTEEGIAADLVVMLTDHAEFRAVPAERMAGRRLIDTRGVWAGRGETGRRSSEGNPA
jgi:UDP-N-acetyl-D-mannosaminuronic acid dehydrogenase